MRSTSKAVLFSLATICAGVAPLTGCKDKKNPPLLGTGGSGASGGAANTGGATSTGGGGRAGSGGQVSGTGGSSGAAGQTGGAGGGSGTGGAAGAGGIGGRAGAPNTGGAAMGGDSGTSGAGTMGGAGGGAGMGTSGAAGSAGAAGAPPGPPQVTQVLPSSTLVGGPVLIRGQNLSTATAVQFNGVDATITFATVDKVATHVPASLPLGSAPIVVFTSAGQSSPTPFNVIAQFLPGPTSPPDIVSAIPPPPGYIPPVDNLWVNEFDSAEEFFFANSTGSPTGTFDGEERDTTSPLTGGYDLAARTLSFTVNRSGGNETFQCEYSETGAAPSHRIICFSLTTGRQLVLFFSF